MKKFNIKDLKEVKTIIGLVITRDFVANTLKIDQKKYIQDFLESKGMTSYHLTVFLVKTGPIFFLDQVSNHQQIDLIAYQHLIKKLIYLTYGTYPNIIFMVKQLSYHNSDLQIRHLCIAKQVLRYLKKTITLGIQ